MGYLVAWASLVNSEAKAMLRASGLEESGTGWAMWECGIGGQLAMKGGACLGL